MGIQEFVVSFPGEDEEKVGGIITDYYVSDFHNTLFDGIARLYNQSKSKWLFIIWALRDALQQRLQSITSNI